MHNPRAYVAFAFLLISALCPAPIINPNENGTPQRELSQEERANQQAIASTAAQPEVGTVPTRTNDNGQQVEQGTGQATARALVSQTIPSDQKASEIVATVKVEEAKPSSLKWLLGGGVLALAFGGVWALRFWNPDPSRFAK